MRPERSGEDKSGGLDSENKDGVSLLRGQPGQALIKGPSENYLVTGGFAEVYLECVMGRHEPWAPFPGGHQLPTAPLPPTCSTPEDAEDMRSFSLLPLRLEQQRKKAAPQGEHMHAFLAPRRLHPIPASCGHSLPPGIST